MDVYLKTDNPVLRANACVRAAGLAATLAGGTFHDATGVLLNAMGTLATVAPDGDSPILPGLTNRPRQRRSRRRSLPAQASISSQPSRWAAAR